MNHQKKREIFQIFFCAAILSIGNIQNPSAQGWSTYNIQLLPIDFDYPPDYTVIQQGGKSWTILGDKTEFDITLFKVGHHRFTADSLKNIIFKLYDDPEIQNLQLVEKGGGTMGKHRAEKCVVSFYADGKQYMSIYYLVYFYINREYNALVFHFEMGELNVPSYSMLMDQMIQSLRFRDFSYTSYRIPGDSIQLKYPDFWTLVPPEEGDTNAVYQFDDGRGVFTLSFHIPKDSTSGPASAEAEKTAMKLRSAEYPGLKVRTGNEGPKTEPIGRLDATYNEAVEGIMRATVFTRLYYRLKSGNQEYEYVVSFKYPESSAKYYEPIFARIRGSLVLPGQPVTPIKK
jgi:hypothetical protein